MRILGILFFIQCSALIVIIGCLVLLQIDIFVALKTSYNAGPPRVDQLLLNVSRRLNRRHDEKETRILTSSKKLIYDHPKNETIPLLTSISQQNSLRIIFTSCNRQRMFNPFWKVIEQLEPNVFIWMGDNIYADHTGSQIQVAFSIIKNFVISPINVSRALLFRSVPLFPPALPSVILDAYNGLLNLPEYRRILSGKNLKLVTGTWDDHDYGVNDGDKTYIHKDLSKKYFLDFFSVPANDSRRSPQHEGIYGVEYVTIPVDNGIKKHLKIAIILLDTRYNKDSWTMDPQIGDLLGNKQWAWLESLLEVSDSDVHLIVSSIQVLVDKRSFLESWSGFPNARHRFLNTVLRSGAKNPIFLSGDVHFSEISTINCRPRKLPDVTTYQTVKDIQLWEFTSSGMTHSTRRVVGTGSYLDVAIRWLLPTDHVDTRIDGLKQIYTGRNMGVIDIVMAGSQPILSFKILNSKSEIVLSKDLVVNGLQNYLSTIEQTFNASSIDGSYNSLPSVTGQQWKSIDWICTPLNGPLSEDRVRLGTQLVFLSSLCLGLFLLLPILFPFRVLWIIGCRRKKSKKQSPTVEEQPKSEKQKIKQA